MLLSERNPERSTGISLRRRWSMRIAILGWGSLIWDRDKDQLSIASDWTKGGPTLPIEFSRVSSDGRLTLVIDTSQGACVTTRFAKSGQSILQEAVLDLTAREKRKLRSGIRNKGEPIVGYIDLTSNNVLTKQPPEIVSKIHEWAQANKFDAVVWTDFPPNFQEKTGLHFSPENALWYLRGLTGNAARKAREYIQRTPMEVKTAVRYLVKQSGWL